MGILIEVERGTMKDKVTISVRQVSNGWIVVLGSLDTELVFASPIEAIEAVTRLLTESLIEKPTRRPPTRPPARPPARRS